MQEPSEGCAREVLEVVPMVMRAIRAEMRRHRGGDLTIPQFRSLLFIQRNPGASLFEVAGHLGLTSPSTCKLVDGLVDRQLVNRQVAPTDRRRITLELTAGGVTLVNASRQATLSRLAATLSDLTETERQGIVQAMQSLRGVFTSEEILETSTGKETYANP